MTTMQIIAIMKARIGMGSKWTSNNIIPKDLMEIIIKVVK